jgi:hypothetical protein
MSTKIETDPSWDVGVCEVCGEDMIIFERGQTAHSSCDRPAGEPIEPALPQWGGMDEALGPPEGF